MYRYRPIDPRIQEEMEGKEIATFSADADEVGEHDITFTDGLHWSARIEEIEGA